MGVLLSYLLIFVVACALMALQLAGAFLIFTSLALSAWRLTFARKRRTDGLAPKALRAAPFVLGFIGICLLVPASVVLFLGRDSGIFEAWAI
ncbi:MULTISPECIES: hypothetical protein [unclassified Streptomyces]|uniref:hypothetical protein n=1 Tax=Streptomyces sp. NPDC127129 TaxID=3345373 RepID=UPI003644BD72